MLDAAEEHLAAVANPMPATVFLVLILVTAAAMATISYECGLGGKMRVLGMLVMPVLLATVILLVYDIAHPRIDPQGPRSDPHAAQAAFLRRVRGRCRRSRGS